MSHLQRSVWVARVARLAEAEGEQDVDLLNQHRANVLMEEALAILQQGQDVRSQLQAISKWVKARLLAPPLELETDHTTALGAALKAAQERADTRFDPSECRLEVGVFNSAIIGMFKGDDGEVCRRWCMQLEEYVRFAGEQAHLFDARMRLLGIDLTAAEWRHCCLSIYFDKSKHGDPCYSQRLAATRRLQELAPTANNSCLLAQAERSGGNAQAYYRAAVGGLAAARQEGSFFNLMSLSNFAANAVMTGALGPKWRFSQVETFVANFREAAPHLRRWMPRAMYQAVVGAELLRLQELETKCDREAARPLLQTAKFVTASHYNRCCAACGKWEMEMRRCSACKAVFYCTAACQKRHWKEHKKECREAVAAQQAGGGAEGGGAAGQQ